MQVELSLRELQLLAHLIDVAIQDVEKEIEEQFDHERDPNEQITKEDMKAILDQGMQLSFKVSGLIKEHFKK